MAHVLHIDSSVQGDRSVSRRLTARAAERGAPPTLITAELTMADGNPAMAGVKPLAADSLSRALVAIDQLWTADENAA